MQRAVLSLFLIASLIGYTQSAITLAVATSDTASTGLFPLALNTGSATGTLALNVATASGTAPGTATTNAAGAATSPTTGTTYYAVYKSSAGIPFNQVWTLTQDATASPPAGALVINIPVGPQVALTVTNSVTGTGGVAGSATPLASASAVTTSLTTCGNYYIDCTTGTLTFNLYVPATVTQTCVVSVTQVPALTGGLAYATTLPTGAQTNLATAVTSNSNGNGSPNFCGTVSNSGNTVYLFTQPLASAASTSDISTAQAKLTAAIKAKTAFTGSARLLEESERVLATSYTLVNGYAQSTPTSIGAGITATPASTASAALAANATSQSRIVVVAGLLTTVLAAVFGLAL